MTCKHQRLWLFQERGGSVREHFVRTIADEHLFGLHAVMGVKHLGQLRFSRDRIKP